MNQFKFKDKSAHICIHSRQNAFKRFSNLWPGTLNKLTQSLAILLLIVSFAWAGDQKAPAKLQVNRTMVTNFFKSLIIPGWGQWSNGHKVRSVAFVTAEIASIYGYQVNYGDGESLETTFKLYADEHWDYQVWSLNDDGETACGNLRTHQMPTIGDIDGDGLDDPLKDHHFYENIGKYPEFSCGWDDYIDGGIGYDYDEDDTKNKAEYIDMRTRSNQLYRYAQVSGTLVMVNHLISAFDAALGTDITTFESTNYTGKVYINPLNALNSIALEVKF